jgi:hypothetical protein
MRTKKVVATKKVVRAKSKPKAKKLKKYAAGGKSSNPCPPGYYKDYKGNCTIDKKSAEAIDKWTRSKYKEIVQSDNNFYGADKKGNVSIVNYKPSYNRQSVDTTGYSRGQKEFKLTSQSDGKSDKTLISRSEVGPLINKWKNKASTEKKVKIKDSIKAKNKAKVLPTVTVTAKKKKGKILDNKTVTGLFFKKRKNK